MLVGSVVYAGCSGKEASPPEPVVTVQSATVERKAIQDVISTEAILYAQSEASIVPKISAPVEKFFVNRGSHVRAGQLLARLENRDLQAAVQQAKGAYEQAEAAYATNTEVNLPADVQSAELNVKETRQSMEANRLVYESRLKLFQSGAISRNLLEQAHVTYIQSNNQYEIAVARLNGLKKVGQSAALKTAAGQLASAQGQYNAALANLQYSEIRSPITGVVTDRPLFEGQMATAGTPLMTVMDPSRVTARAYVTPQEAALLHVGDPATLLPGEGQPEVSAKVLIVSPALDPNSTTVQVWVEAANPKARLKPGSTVGVRIVAKTVKDALIVPNAAILTAPDGSTSVMVIDKDQHAHQTAVKTGIREGELLQIVSGLHAGDHVVTQGAYGLPDGAKVQVSEPAAPKRSESE
ncbi:MAG TPA: efflux RND transporter periplasmic adaptor subunit [Candidatus Acidoferrum sp.]|nr:efflux RND transporter periplasmic adaptor subunit [Candidatus Acidoferrum sp.]